MYREILLGISGVALYPIVSLLLFVATFGLVLVQVGRMDRTRVERCAALPFEGEPAEREGSGK
jgi:hypothetical protein